MRPVLIQIIANHIDAVAGHLALRGTRLTLNPASELDSDESRQKMSGSNSAFVGCLFIYLLFFTPLIVRAGNEL